MSLGPIAQSQVLQKHLDPKVSRFLGFQIREVEVRCIFAFSEKVVSSSYGPSEP
jgi:hypothetical protein